MATGEKVTIRCITSTDIDDDMNWCQQKPGEPPNLLISEGNTLRPGVPSRFSSSGYGTDFLLTIENTLSEDVADYYYLQSDIMPLTVLCPLTETCKCCQCHYISCNWSCSVCDLINCWFLFPPCICTLTSFFSVWSILSPLFFLNPSLRRDSNSLNIIFQGRQLTCCTAEVLSPVHWYTHFYTWDQIKEFDLCWIWFTSI